MPESSFIPKAPIRNAPPVRTVRRMYVLQYISIVFFLSTVVVTGVVLFLYFNELSNLTQQQKRLEEARQLAFDNSRLEELREFSLRTKEASKILNENVPLVLLLTSLESTIVNTLVVSEFLYGQQEDGSNAVSLTVSSPDYNTLLFQRNVLQDDPLWRGARIDQISYGGGIKNVEDLQDVDLVSFTLVQPITPSLFEGVNADTSVTSEEQVEVGSDEPAVFEVVEESPSEEVITEEVLDDGV